MITIKTTYDDIDTINDIVKESKSKANGYIQIDSKYIFLLFRDHTEMERVLTDYKTSVSNKEYEDMAQAVNMDVRKTKANPQAKVKVQKKLLNKFLREHDNMQQHFVKFGRWYCVGNYG